MRFPLDLDGDLSIFNRTEETDESSIIMAVHCFGTGRSSHGRSLLTLFTAALVLTVLMVACGDDKKDNPVGPNNPPNEPTNDTAHGSPADGATGVILRPTIRWTGGDPDGERVTFTLYFGVPADPPLIGGGWSDSSYVPELPLLGGRTYHWRVVAKDERGERTSSPIWSFTTVP